MMTALKSILEKPLFRQMHLTLLILVAAICMGLICFTPPVSGKTASKPVATMSIPADYREWVYLTSGLDMTYVAPSTSADAASSVHVFDNVFVNPQAYRSFVQTGTWPDKTSFVLENRVAEQNVSINKGGSTQSTVVHGTEMHVKENGQWSFYMLNATGTLKLIPRPANCYTCHEAHGAVDTTFVQFYPTLIPIAQQKKTFSTDDDKPAPSAPSNH